MSIDLESIGQDRPTAYGVVGAETDRVQLTFTNIQGQGYAQVWLRSGENNKFVRKLSTVSLFDVSNYVELVYFNFSDTDEIGVNLVGYSSDVPFRATLDISLPSGESVGGVDESVILNLDTRVSRLETIVDGIGSGGGSGPVSGDVGIRLNSIETGFSALKTDHDTTKSSLAALTVKQTGDTGSLNSAITSGLAAVNSRIDNLSLGGGGEGITNIIQTVVASQGSATKTLDAAYADRYDIVGDATNTFNITNVKNTNNLERVLTLAAITDRRGTTRTYNGVTQWLTSDGQPPAADNRVGYGELIYLTNIHGSVIGNARTGVQFKYGLPVSGVFANYPLVESTGPVASIVGTRTATVTKMTSDPTGGFLASAPDASGFGSIIEDTSDARNARGFSVWFTLASITASGTRQVIINVGEGDDLNSAYILEANGSSLLFRHRNASNGITDTNLGTVQAGVPYVVTASLVFTAGSQSATIYVRNRNTGIETATTVSNFAFSDRRTSNSRVFAGAGVDRKSNLTTGSKIRAFVIYSGSIGASNKDIVHESYL